MPVTINASPTNGLVQTADGSGVLKVQSNGVTTNALAWVNFNGTGTVAIRASYNVSSITDNGTGDYTVNFTTALTDANYAGMVSAGDYGSLPRSVGGQSTATRTTTSYKVLTLNATQASFSDCDSVFVSIFGN